MKTSNIYDKHRAAFSRVTAAALVKSGNQIGTIAFKYPADGAGRLYCYLHIHGEEMVRGSASGYGYDKAGAAFESAVSAAIAKPENSLCRCLLEGCDNIGGVSWADALRQAGIDVFMAI